MRGIVASTDLVSEECCNCGVSFGLAKAHRAELLRSHKNFYCPNGHSQHYTGETDEERERRWREEAERQRDAVRQELASTRHALRAEKGHVTRLKRRAAAGVCTCCHRTFNNVARHMATKHPQAVKAVRGKRGA